MLSTFDFAGHVIGLIIDKDLNHEILEKIIEEIEQKRKVHEEINVFIELEKGRKITLDALWGGIKYKYSHADYFNKIAIVTDSKWFQASVNISDIFLDVEVKTYDNKDRLEAINWISL